MVALDWPPLGDRLPHSHCNGHFSRKGVAQTCAVCGSAAFCVDLANALLVRTASRGLKPLLPRTGSKRRFALHGSIISG